METTTAATLQKKKINKGKLKKTIKNILCRPDPVFWPTLSNEGRQEIEAVLSNHKVNIPEYKKPLWKDIKSIPKDQRPKPPKLEKVNGLLFGISQCLASIQSGECTATVIESTVNPRTIVQPVLEACISNKVPVVCIEDLRKITAAHFGISTSCLGVHKDCLLDVTKVLKGLGESKLPKPNKVLEEDSGNKDKIQHEIDNKKQGSPMEVEEKGFQYLYRTNKKTRVFVPSPHEQPVQATKKFKGQDFIEFSNKQEPQSKQPFMKMVVKRISNNPNRVKVK